MTTDTTSIAPVEKTLTVPATPQQAFALFTGRMADWWPGDRHSVSAMAEGARPEKLVFEASPGGAVFEITPDGTRHDWGVIDLWEPPGRFAMTWHPGQPEADATRVEIGFEAVPEGCRVTLVHSGWDRLGEAARARRDGYDSGWDGVLADFKAACT